MKIGDGDLKGATATPMNAQAYAVVTVCFLCWMFAAIGNGVYAVASPMLKQMFNINNATMGALMSAFSFGGFVSTLVIPKIADNYGRRIGLAICVLIVVFTNGVYGVIGSLGMLFFVRFMCNWGNTCIWAINASYISEIVPSAKRAYYTGMMQAGTPVGNFTASFLISLLMGVGLSWKTVSYSFFIALILLIPIFFLLKETPVWLQNKIDIAAAKKAEQDKLEAAAGLNKSQSYAELFKKEYRKNVFIGSLISMLSAILTWANTAYFVLSLSQMGYAPDVRNTMFMAFWGSATLGYAAAGWVADRIGRKKAMVLFRTPMVVALGIIWWMFNAHSLNTGVVYFALIVAGLSMGGITISITYTNEMMPSHVRTMGTGFAIGMGRLASMVGVFLLGVLADATSVPFAWWLSSIIGWLMVPVIYMGVETAGKNITEISA